MRLSNRGSPGLILASLLAGCAGASGGHAECKDAISTQAYGVKWMDDLAAAREAGTVTMDQVVDLQGRNYEKLSLLKEGKWTEYCKHIDAVREEGGF